MKSTVASEARTLQNIPNIGPAMAETFALLGIKTPTDLKKQDPYALYEKLCRISGTRYDPCVLDTFMAAVDFMNGAPPKPWWDYTQSRKEQHPNI